MIPPPQCWQDDNIKEMNLEQKRGRKLSNSYNYQEHLIPIFQVSHLLIKSQPFEAGYNCTG